MARPKKIWTAEQLLAHTHDDAGCLVWTGRMHTRIDVPLCNHAGRVRSVRRLLLELLGRTVPETAFVRCRCGTPACIEPGHLQVLTRQQHMSAVSVAPRSNELLRRARIAETKRARYSRLTPAQVQEVRNSPESGVAVARRLGVSKTLTNRIRRGDAWVEFSSPWAGLGAR